jgi:hypothetical protein
MSVVNEFHNGRLDQAVKAAGFIGVDGCTEPEMEL